MSRLVLVLDLAADSRLWDPHEAVEDVLARGDQLPTFTPDCAFVLSDVSGLAHPADGDPDLDVEGIFRSAEWVDTLRGRAVKALQEVAEEHVGLNPPGPLDVVDAVFRAIGLWP